MNKVLMTGLALGTDVGVCNACNYDFEWVFKNPSIFLWADKILLTQTINDLIINEHIVDTKSLILPKSIKLIFEMAKNENIIEIIDPTSVITDEITSAIWNEVYQDRVLLKKFFPNLVNISPENGDVPLEIIINDMPYCGPYVATIYATLALTSALEANCFFNNSALNYLIYKFGIRGIPGQVEPGKVEAFTNIFNAYLPHLELLPEYVRQSLSNNDICESCSREISCKDTYLNDIENSFSKILSWRNYDEIFQLKQVINEIIQKRSKSNGIIDPNEILNEFMTIESNYRRRLKKIFPEIRRWANISTMLSVPIALMGLATSQPLVTVTGALLTQTSKLTEESLKYLTSKMNWIGFTANVQEFQDIQEESVV